MKKLKNAIPFIGLAFVTVWLRLSNLGYSDYQGDEIKALYRPQAGQELFEFLLSQRKGPAQFLVTYVVGIFNPSYNNQLLVRLPFAIAGILSVYFFYKFAKLEFGKTIAFYSSFFISTNGLFVAFARIVQYQSFVTLFSILALYFLSLSTKYKTWRIYGLYLGMCCWGISILAHYDGVFIAPFALYIIHKWYVSKANLLSRVLKLKHLIFVFAIFTIIIAVFYIPFFFSLSESTKAYWSDRITKKSGSSISTFTTYNPTFVVYFYALLGLISLFKFKQLFTVWLWFLFPLLFMEVLVSYPGTHIYTYLIPFCILIAYGLREIGPLSKKIFKNKSNFINNSTSAFMLLLIFLVSNTAFVEHSKEYPWEKKSFLMWEFPIKRRLSLFGFPYYRHWEEIGLYLKKVAGSDGYYITNEKKSIVRYYVPSNFINLQLQADTHKLDGYVYIIYIKNPQSRTELILDKEPSYWDRYKPITTFSNDNKMVVKIYRLSASELEKIKK